MSHLILFNNAINVFFKSSAKITFDKFVKRYIGDVSMDQISVSLRDGKRIVLKLKEVNYLTDAINTDLEQLKLPFEVVDCFTQEICVEFSPTDPDNLVNIKITDQLLTINMINACDINDESLTASVASAGDLADSAGPNNDFVTAMANIYKYFTNQLVFEIDNIKIRLQFISKVSNVGIAIEITASNLHFCNRYNKGEHAEKEDNMNIPLYENKKLTFHDLDFYIEEFIPVTSKHDDDNVVIDPEEENESELDNLSLYSKDIILFCQVFGKQEFCYGQKKDDIFGPDNNLILSLDSVYFFLTPKQIQQFIMAMNIFLLEVKLKPDDKWKASSQAPMTDSDYQKVDIAMKRNMDLKRAQELTNYKDSWSGPPEYDPTAPLDPYGVSYCQSKYSDAATSFYSVKSDFEDNKTSSTKNKKETVTHFSININIINGIVLHEDLLLTSDNECTTYRENSINDLQNKAKGYFDKVKYYQQPASFEALSEITSSLLDACPLNHFMLFVTPIQLQIEISSDNAKFSNAVELSVGSFDLYENLKTENYMANVIQIKNPCTTDPAKIDLCPLLTMKQSGNFIHMTKQKCLKKCNTSAMLGNCTIKLDFTIIQRLKGFFDLFENNVLHSHSSVINSDLSDTSIYMFSINEEENSIPMNVSVTATNLSFVIQFPIPDCKNMSLVPKLRKEIVHIEFDGMLCKTLYDCTSSSSRYELFLDEVRGYFQEKHNYVKIPIIRLTKDESHKIVLSIDFPETSHDPYDKPETEKSDNKDCTSTVFTTKTIISECLGEKSIKKELLLPADIRYVGHYFCKAKRNAFINLEANIPCAQLSLPNKHTYEVLYNLFLIDLFVWFTEVLPSSFENNSKKEHDVKFSESSDSFYYSHMDGPLSQAAVVDKEKLFSFGVSIGEASISIRTPCKENNKVFIGKHGEVIIKLSGGTLLANNEYVDNSSKTYLFIDSDQISMFHRPNCNTQSTHSLNQEFDLSMFDPIFVPTQNGFNLIEMNKEATERGLLLSMEISFDLIRNVSRTVLACGLYGITLNYKMCSPETVWFNQLAEVFQIEYAAISGYEHPCEVTEVNFLASNCLVAYDPINLPLKSIISIGTLWVSLTSCYTSNKFTTHIFFEDSGLFLSKNLASNTCNADSVCVVHVGYFELCHNSYDKDESDISISNSDIHIRTCTDSCNALMELLIYLSNGGDLIKEPIDIKPSESVRNAKLFIPEHDPLAQECIQLVADALDDFGPISPPSVQRQVNKANKVKQMSFPRRPEGECYDSELSDDDDLEIIYADDDAFCMLDNIVGAGVSEELEFPPELSTVNSMGGDDSPYKPDYDSHQSNILVGVIKEMTVIWHLYGGKDFTEADKTQKQTISIDQPISYSNLMRQDNFSDSQACKSSDSSKRRPKMYYCELGGPCRSHDKVMEVRIERIRLEFENFTKESSYSSTVALFIKKVEILDKIALSRINMFLYEDPQYSYQLSDNGYMMRIQLKLSKEETAESNIAISIRPLRVNVDQHALVHISTYFSDLLSDESSELGRVEEPSTPKVGAPTLTLYIDGKPCLVQQSNDVNCNSNIELETYIKEFEFYPALPIKIDYEGKGVVNSKYGSVTGMFIALGRLNHSNIRLKSLHYRGVLGYNKLCSLMVNDWYRDIRRNQVGGIVGGVGPLRAISELFSGVRDLIYLPIEQYKKDGRVLTGMKRGTISFASSSVHATLDLAEKCLGCVQSLAEVMHDVVSQGPREKRRSNIMSAPPKDIRDGVNTAMGIISDGLESTADTIYRAALEEHSYYGITGAVGGVIRQVPQAVMSPIILASEATCTVIGGLKNQLNPSERREAIVKWK